MKNCPLSSNVVAESEALDCLGTLMMSGMGYIRALEKTASMYPELRPYFTYLAKRNQGQHSPDQEPDADIVSTFIPSVVGVFEALNSRQISRPDIFIQISRVINRLALIYGFLGFGEELKALSNPTDDRENWGLEFEQGLEFTLKGIDFYLLCILVDSDIPLDECVEIMAECSPLHWKDVVADHAHATQSSIKGIGLYLGEPMVDVLLTETNEDTVAFRRNLKFVVNYLMRQGIDLEFNFSRNPVA